MLDPQRTVGLKVDRCDLEGRTEALRVSEALALAIEVGHRAGLTERLGAALSIARGLAAFRA